MNSHVELADSSFKVVQSENSGLSEGKPPEQRNGSDDVLLEANSRPRQIDRGEADGLARRLGRWS